jgi:hypothetical protein
MVRGGASMEARLGGVIEREREREREIEMEAMSK